MKTAIATLLTALAALPAAAASAADAVKPEQLHAQHCVKCHASDVYTRPNRRVTSLPGLRKQVRMCETNLGLRWFDEEVEGVVSYLNQGFYHFKE